MRQTFQLDQPLWPYILCHIHLWFLSCRTGTILCLCLSQQLKSIQQAINTELLNERKVHLQQENNLSPCLGSCSPLQLKCSNFLIHCVHPPLLTLTLQEAAYKTSHFPYLRFSFVSQNLNLEPSHIHPNLRKNLFLRDSLSFPLLKEEPT